MEPLLLIIYGLLFVAAIMLIEGALQLKSVVHNPQKRAINRRLRLLDSGYDPDEIYRLLRRKRDDGGWAKFSLLRLANTFLQQAGITASVPVVVVVMLAAAALLSGAAVIFLRLPIPLAVGGASLGIVALAYLYVSMKRKARLDALEAQLPEMLDLVVRSVRSGHPLNTALRLAANELPEPLGSEVGLLVDETTYGTSLIDAVDNLAERVGLSDYNYFAVVSKITSKTGGNLADILGNLASVMRDRNRMKRKIKAISAEGRASGLVMSLAPPGIAGMILLISPSFFMDVADDVLFPYLIGLVGFLCLANFLALRKLVSFEF